MSKERGGKNGKRDLGRVANENLEEVRDHEQLAKYPVKYLAHGGEHLVYELMRNREGKEQVKRGLVVKVKDGLVQRSVRELAQRNKLTRLGGEAPVEESKGESSKLTEREILDITLEREESFFNKLGRYFPSESFLGRHAEIMTVPVGANVAREILKDSQLDEYIDDGILDIETVVTIQERIPEEAASAESSRNFGIRYIEKIAEDNEEAADYSVMIFGSTEFDSDKFHEGIHPSTRTLLKEAKDSPELTGQIKEFIKQLITFTQTEGRGIDIAGQGNVRFYQDSENKWKYLMPDPYAGKFWEHGKAAIAEIAENKRPIAKHEIYDILNGFSYARFVNGMAQEMDLEERLQFLPEGMEDEEIHELIMGTSEDLRKFFKWQEKPVDPEEDVDTKSLQDSVDQTISNPHIEDEISHPGEDK
jgi:hypothetical protein